MLLSVMQDMPGVVSRGQTAYFSAGRYRLQYKRPFLVRALILQAITPCTKISDLATRDYARGFKFDSVWMRVHQLQLRNWMPIYDDRCRMGVTD